MVVCPYDSAGQAEALTDDLLAGDEPPDAIAAMSEELALGALRAAQRAGIPIPAALSIRGWDDSEAVAPAG